MLVIVAIVIGIDLYYSYTALPQLAPQGDMAYAYMFALPKTIYPPIAQLQTTLAKFRTTVPFDCSKKIVPAPMKDLDLANTYMKDAGGKDTTVRDPAVINKNNTIKEPLTKMQRLVADLMTDMVLSNPADTKKVQDCLLEALYKWASVGALTGKISPQGYVDRMNFVVTMAAAFLKINQAYPAGDKKVDAIEKWLDTLEKSGWKNFVDRDSNLKTWAVLSHYLVSIATQNQDMYNESIREFTDQVNFIENNGAIKSELTRKDRSSTYLVYYAAPLVAMQYMMKVSNESKYNQPKVHNLVNLIINIIKDPQYLVKQNLVAAADKQLPFDPRVEFLALYDAMFKTEFIKPDNKDVYTQQVNKYKNNPVDNIAYNLGNFTSMFGV